jgi:ribonuclease HI
LCQQKTRNSPGEVATLLHPDFFEIGQSGTVWNRQQTIDKLAQEHPMERPLTDLSVRSLAADLTLVTYRAVGRDLASGNEWHSLGSSVWKLIDSR